MKAIAAIVVFLAIFFGFYKYEVKNIPPTVSPKTLVENRELKPQYIGKVTVSAPPIAVGIYELRAGTWMEFGKTPSIPPGKHIKIDTKYGIPFTYMYNDDGVERQSGPKGEFKKEVLEVLESVKIKPSKDMSVAVSFVDP